MRSTARVGMQVEILIITLIQKYGKAQTNQQRVGVGRFFDRFYRLSDDNGTHRRIVVSLSLRIQIEVGHHPPGAPSSLTANLFTQFASDPSKVAVMVNTMSALFSGLTILFLFWSITHLARKIIVEDDKTMSLGQMITIMGCGLLGSLAYTFSDTFWFSAVEGEVYAYSSLFTALVFWLILKWEEAADRPHADRWIVLIAYLMGLSIGVHLLNLLCIPAIVLVYYYKKFPNPTMKGTLIALLVSFAIVGLMTYGVVQGLVEVCGYFELLFVNTSGSNV